jgi:hypothetical protein
MPETRWRARSAIPLPLHFLPIDKGGMILYGSVKIFSPGGFQMNRGGKVKKEGKTWCRSGTSTVGLKRGRIRHA